MKYFIFLCLLFLGCNNVAQVNGNLNNSNNSDNQPIMCEHNHVDLDWNLLEGNAENWYLTQDMQNLINTDKNTFYNIIDMLSGQASKKYKKADCENWIEDN